MQAPLIYSLIIGTGVLITAGMFFAGPRLPYGAIVYVLGPVFAFFLLHRRIAWVLTALATIELGAVLVFQRGWADPLVMWMYISVVVASSAVVLGSIMTRADQLAAAEYEARLELAELNEDLEAKVAEQVDELARLAQLRRFLSPSLADVILSAGSEEILRPHRREIAVFFCDLRNYTHFAVSEAPEDVLTSLGEYYVIVCGILHRHNATIGNFTGDGVMAFLNDPLPHPDPAGGALSIALELRDEMVALVERWSERRFDLGYGVGIAVGHATLGLLGTHERSDYTAVGPVVNLAARLCAEAGNGKILIDQRAQTAVSSWIDTETLEPVALKGFPEPVCTYSVIGPRTT